MRLATDRCNTLGLPWRILLLIGSALSCMSLECLFAKDDRTTGLPPNVARSLRWLPEDTETLFVAGSVTLPDPNPNVLQNVQWQEIGVGLACEDLLLEQRKHIKPLQGRKIACLVRGARNFESVSKLGSLRSEGCSIITFETDLGDAAREWTEGLRKEARAIRTLVGREVFVFPSVTRMDRFARATEWQGTYLVLLKPNTVLCASSDRYLASVLRRVDAAPEGRALPDNLPEWKHVAFDAPVWMLRHVPHVGEKAHIAGLTVAFERSGLHVVCVPKIGSDLDADRIKHQWLANHAQFLPDRLKSVRQPDGAVVLSFDGEFGEETHWFAFQLYWLQAFEILHLDE